LTITEWEDDQTQLADSIDDEEWTVASAAAGVLGDVSQIVKD
jgi:hypothetical protein